MLGGNLRWTSIPSRGNRNTPSRFIVQKPEIWAFGSPNFDWGKALPLPLPLRSQASQGLIRRQFDLLPVAVTEEKAFPARALRGLCF